MVKTRPDENNPNIIVSYSDLGKQIRPVFDRLGKPIREDALYPEAYDVIVDDKPRYDYEETDIDIEIEEQEEATIRENQIVEENVTINAQSC